MEAGSQEGTKDPRPHFATSGGGERKVRASGHRGGPSPACGATTSIVKNFERVGRNSQAGLPSFLPSGLSGPVTRGLSVSRMPLVVVTPASGSYLEAT